jgi:hypothetical protein
MAAFFHQFLGSAATNGIKRTSGGIGKKELSIKAMPNKA